MHHFKKSHSCKKDFCKCAGNDNHKHGHKHGHSHGHRAHHHVHAKAHVLKKVFEAHKNVCPHLKKVSEAKKAAPKKACGPDGCK